MSEAILVVDHLVKRFDRKAALQDLSFCVDVGEIVGLIGPNGAGKSTAFGVLSGLLRADGGSVRFRGAAVGPERSRFISLVPETPDVYPLLTIWEHLGFVARLCRLAAGWEAKAQTLLERFELYAARSVLGSDLSKGMRQKTLIAATLLAGTPVLLLDEPMIGLDPLGQHELRTILRELRADGVAIMLSTHQLEAAESLCDRVVIVHDGRDVASGTIAQIRSLGSGTLEDVFLNLTRAVR